MPLPYEYKVTSNKDQFIARVQRLATKLDVPTSWLMIVMNFESGLDPKAKNPYSSATGLIQFMYDTAIELGTTTMALYNMSNVEQMEYVDKYLSNVKSRYGAFNGIEDLYLAIFYPAAIRWPMDRKFPDRVYRVNKVFDLNKDGVMTKLEVHDKILQNVPNAYLGELKKKPLTMDKKIVITIAVLMMMSSAYLIYTRGGGIVA